MGPRAYDQPRVDPVVRASKASETKNELSTCNWINTEIAIATEEVRA